MLDWVVLQPARFGVPQFDANRQTLVWPLFDAEEQPLVAELAYSELNEHAIMRIEQLDVQTLPEGTRLVGRVSHSQGRLLVEPLSLVRQVSGENANAVDALHFDAAPTRTLVSKWRQRFRTQPDTNAAPAVHIVLARASLPAALVDLRNQIRVAAERGRQASGTAAVVVHPAFEQARARCEQIGFSAFAASVSHGRPSAHLLKTNYVRMQYERLLGDEESPLE
jgi:hypothetical protein